MSAVLSTMLTGLSTLAKLSRPAVFVAFAAIDSETHPDDLPDKLSSKHGGVGCRRKPVMLKGVVDVSNAERRGIPASRRFCGIPPAGAAVVEV